MIYIKYIEQYLYNMCSIVVNSCKDYYDKTVQPLITSLEEANIPKERIFVVVGDCDTNEEQIIDGIQYIFRRYSNMDNNGIMWITQENPSCLEDWIIYLHDTSLVVKDFWQKSLDIINDPSNNEVSCIRLYANHSMGMGFYKKEWMYSNHVMNYMKAIVNEDKSKRQELKNNLDLLEDTLFKYAIRTANGICKTLVNEYKVVERDRKMYGTDIPRIVEYYESPGIYKIKANWTLPVFVKL